MFDSTNVIHNLFPLIFIALFILPLLITFLILKRIYLDVQEQEMTAEKMTKCTAQVQGRVSCTIKVKVSFSLPIGTIPPIPCMKFSVKYKVNGKFYRIKERAVYRKRMTPIIGYMQSTPIACWRKVTVCYNPENPQMAYVLDNAKAEE